MPKESKTAKQPDLLARLYQARALVDDCIADIQGQPRRRLARTPSHASQAKSAPAPRDLDFEANERAFVKAHARGLSGPKKFVLLLAHLTKGKLGVDVELKNIEKHWNRMTAPNLLDGKFNRFYTNSAKESGWVNTKKQGMYSLRPQWRDIFS